MDCCSCGALLSAGSRFCNRCGAPQSIACESCRHDNAPGSGFCSFCGAKLATAVVQSRMSKRASMPAAAPIVERRQLTVMFCDLVGSTALSTRLDPEDLREVITAYHECIAETVRRFQGYVAQYLGDGALVYFGYPNATENDAERAIRAALAVIAAVADLNPHAQRLAVRVGIATGAVVVGEIIGPVANPERGAIGETPNLAARLQALAEPNAVVIANSTRRLTGRLFDYDDLGRHEFKGFAEPIQAWRVRSESTHEDRHQALRWSHGPLAGRRLELDQLRTVLSTCKADWRGRAVYIRGDAGIGKTRLLDEFMSIAGLQGFVCHTGLVLDFGTGIGRDAIGMLARDILELPPTASEDTARTAIERAVAGGLVDNDDVVFLNDLLEVPQPIALRAVYDAMDNDTRAAGKRSAIARLVERSSGVQPRVLAVEDLHWADGPTLTHLAALAATVADCPAILVMTSRLEQDPLDQGWRAQAGTTPLVVIDLGPLRADEAAIMAAPLLDTDAAKRCVERAAGNPLFLEQLLRNVAEGDSSAVPGSVQNLVQARLDRLDPSDKAALQTASVLGQRFDRDALVHLLAAPDFDPKRMLTRGMVHGHGDEFLFAHALIHEAVYDGLLKSRRRELHRCAADWFARRDATLAASHLDRASDPGAAAAYLEAARAQRRQYRYDAARKLVERGLVLASSQVNRFDLSCLLGDILYDFGDMPAALSAFEGASRVAGGDAERCRAWIGCAQVKRVIDDIDGAFADLERAEAAAVSLGLEAEEARVRFLRGNLYFPRGDVDGCLREHGRSLDLAREVGAPELEAEALGGLGDAEYMRGHMISAYGRFQACIALSDRHGFGRIGSANRPMAALTRWYAGETDAALADARVAIAAAKRVRHLRAEMIAQHAAYFCFRDHAELDAAAEHLRHALRIARQLKAPRFEAEGLAFLAELDRRAGRRVEARTNIQTALAISRNSGMAYMGPIILGIAALIADDDEGRREALAEADALLAAGAVSHNHLLFGRDAIEVCLEMGDWERADRYASALEAYTRAEPLPWSEFFIARGRALAEVGRNRTGRDHRPALRRLLLQAEHLGYLVALPALRGALARIEVAS